MAVTNLKKIADLVCQVFGYRKMESVQRFSTDDPSQHCFIFAHRSGEYDCLAFAELTMSSPTVAEVYVLADDEYALDKIDADDPDVMDRIKHLVYKVLSSLPQQQEGA